MIKRHLEESVLAGLADSPVVLLVGARQTGKSTLIQAPEFQTDNRRFLTFDDTVFAAEAKQHFLRGVVLYTGQEVLPFGDKLVAMPVSALWRLGI